MREQEIIKALAKQLRSALLLIEYDHEDDFRNDYGDPLCCEDGGNYSVCVFDGKYGDFSFDFANAEEALLKAGYCIKEEVK